MKISYQKTVTDTFINSIADFVLVPLILIRLPLLTKNLSTQEYGIWTLIFTTIGLLTPFTTLGLGVAMSRFLPAEKNIRKIQNGFYSVLSIRLLITLIVVLPMLLFESQLAQYLFNGSLELVRMTAALIFFSILESLYIRLITIIRKIKVRSIFRIIQGYCPIVLIAILFLKGYGFISIVYAFLAIKIITVSFLIIYVTFQIGFIKPNFSIIKEYLSFGLPTLPASMGFWFVNLTDRFIIAFLMGSAAVGVYSASYQIGSIPYIFSTLINFILMVSTSKLYDSGKIDEVKTHLSYALKYFLALVIPFIFALLILSKQLLFVFSTPEIAIEGYSICILIAIANLFLGIYNVIRYILLITKKTKILAAIWLISAPINLILNILLIPLIGINGAAISTVFCYFIAMLIASFISFKEFSFHIDLIFIIKSILASIIMSLSIYIIKPQEGLVYTLLIIVMGAAIYGSALFLMKGFSQKELTLFKNLFVKS